MIGYITIAQEKTRPSKGELLGIELEVRRYPDPVLKKVAEPVTAFDDELADFVGKMCAVMRVSDGGNCPSSYAWMTRT